MNKLGKIGLVKFPISLLFYIFELLAMCKETPNMLPMFDDEKGFYNYCPSSIRNTSDTETIFYCANKDPFKIIDYIHFRKSAIHSGKPGWSEKKIVLSPSESGWDSIHVCDPDVVKGQFLLEGRAYHYALFFLGCDTLDNTHNQIGVAYSENIEGPFIKWKGNPLITCKNERCWGVGQSSAVSLDRKGKLLLFHTRGDSDGTRMVFRELDLSNAGSPVLGKEVVLPISGLTSINGSRVVLNNGAVAYDAASDVFYIVRDRHPHEKTPPGFISSQVQVAGIKGDLLKQGRGAWKVLGEVTPKDSSKPRNHNACIVKDEYGFIPGGGNIEVDFSVSELDPGSLWTYRIYRAVFSKDKSH